MICAYPSCDAGLGYTPGPPFGHFIGMGQYNAAAPISDAGSLAALDQDGFDSGDAAIINAIYQQGALTAQDWTMLLNDDIDATTLLTDITNTPTTGVAPTVSTNSSSAQSPPGSTLLYSANWTAGVSNLLQSPNSVISAIGSTLATHGLSVVSSSVTGNGPINYGIQLVLHDTIGHALLTDVQSILHSLMVSAVGNNLSGESTVVTAMGGSSASTAAPGATSGLTSWLSANATTVALVGVLGLVGVALLKKV